MTASNSRQPARRALRLLWVLQGQTFEGMRLTKIAEALGVPPSTAHRDLHVLADEGVAERIPGREDFWRLSPRIIQLARAHDDEVQRLRRRVDEVNQRYTRNPG